MRDPEFDTVAKGPAPGTTIKLDDLCVEILQINDNAVKTARVRSLPKGEPAIQPTDVAS